MHKMLQENLKFSDFKDFRKFWVKNQELEIQLNLQRNQSSPLIETRFTNIHANALRLKYDGAEM